MAEKFRAHHILCTALYEGKGYSNAFCANMTALTERLRSNPEELVLLVAKPDMICANCPHHTELGDCTDKDGRVAEKDRCVMQRLGLSENRMYSYRKLCCEARTHMTREIFLEICGTCEWRMQGLCSYEELLVRLDACINASCG